MEASSRFWCGAAVGLFIGAVLSLWFLLYSPITAGLTCLATSLLCGALAIPYGEDFWCWIRRVLRLLPYT